MKHTIQILHITQVAGRSKKTGNDYDMRMAQCIVHKINRATNLVEPLVGELLLPEKFKDTVPGTYEVEFDVAISRDKRVGAEVFSIEAIKEEPQRPSHRHASSAPAAAT